MNTSKPITERQQAFLDAYRVHGKVKPAAEQAGCSRELHYGAMRTSETYREEFALAQQRRADELEEAMWQRAVYGVKIPKFYRGKVIGYDIQYSDTLLMRLLEANDPEKFGGIRKELQQESREDGFCVRWDRDEVARPTLPRMTGPQPPAPPRPPRPPVPPIAELGVPVTYAEWAAARGITGTADCGPVDQEKIQRWAAGGECSPIEWVPEEAGTDLANDDADADLCQEGVAGIDDPESDDSDVDLCVRWDAAEADLPGDGSAREAAEEMPEDAQAPGRGNHSRWSEGPNQKENAATVGRFPVRQRLSRVPAPRPSIRRLRRIERPATFGHALAQSLPGVPYSHIPSSTARSPYSPGHRPLASQPPLRNPSRSPPRSSGTLVSGRPGTTTNPLHPFLLPSGRALPGGPTRWPRHPQPRPP